MSELTREKLEEMQDFAIEAFEQASRSFKKTSWKEDQNNALNAIIAAIKATEALGRTPSQPGSGWG